MRNSSNASRQFLIGIQLQGLHKIGLDDLIIDGFNRGLEILNGAVRTTSTPTLTNIRVRNSSNASRNENVGVYLGQGVYGTLSQSRIEEAKIGIMVAEGNRTELSYNTILNCETGIRASGANGALPIQRQIILLEPQYLAENPDLEYRALEVIYQGNWLIANNTISGYPLALKASSSTIIFTNNIIWGLQGIFTPFSITATALNQSYNDINYLDGIYPGLGNINADPQFMAALDGDYSLSYNSPCIDAGNPLFMDEDGTTSDIGAYTYLHRASLMASARFVLTGTTVHFTNTSWGHDYPLSITQWDLGNDSSIESTGRDFSYQFDQPGIYHLRLTMNSGTLTDTRLYQAIVIAQNLQLKPPGELNISTLNGNIQLTWSAVTETIQNQPALVTNYLVYQADLPTGFFDFAGFTENGQTSILLPGAAGSPGSSLW